MRSSAWILGVWALVGCGSVNDLSMPSAPLATVRARVDLAAVSAKAAGRPLIAALVWARLPSVPRLCLRYPDDADLQAMCPDPFGVFPGAIESTTPLEPAGDGTITFLLDHLPSANVLVGTDVDHVAYATILVGADSDGSGQLSLRPADANGGGRGNGEASTKPSDELLAASFMTLKADQQRLSFREGSFDALTLFYPLPACGVPPAGFSVISTGAYTDPSATCRMTELETVIDVPVIDGDAAKAMACRASGGGAGNNGNNGRIEEAGAGVAQIGGGGAGPGGGNGNGNGGGPGGQGGQDGKGAPDFSKAHCLSQTLAVIAGQGSCPAFTAYALVGCADDAECETPEWDHREDPPEGWPCAP